MPRSILRPVEFQMGKFSDGYNLTSLEAEKVGT